MLIVVTCCGIAFVFFVIGYDEGHNDGFVEGTKSLVNASYRMRELENELRTCRIDRDILRRKYNDLMRKIKAMEGVAE